MMDATAEKKFLALKRRLDALHYKQPLSKKRFLSNVVSY